jgi:hypothetical protein
LASSLGLLIICLHSDRAQMNRSRVVLELLAEIRDNAVNYINATR